MDEVVVGERSFISLTCQPRFSPSSLHDDNIEKAKRVSSVEGLTGENVKAVFRGASFC